MLDLRVSFNLKSSTWPRSSRAAISETAAAPVFRLAVSIGPLFSFEEIIAHITKDETLMPGEFIGSGTVGNGCGLEIGWYLEHNDEIELEVEKIGVLRNKVVRQDI